MAARRSGASVKRWVPSFVIKVGALPKQQLPCPPRRQGRTDGADGHRDIPQVSKYSSEHVSVAVSESVLFSLLHVYLYYSYSSRHSSSINMMILEKREQIDGRASSSSSRAQPACIIIVAVLFQRACRAPRRLYLYSYALSNI